MEENSLIQIDLLDNTQPTPEEITDYSSKVIQPVKPAEEIKPEIKPPAPAPKPLNIENSPPATLPINVKTIKPKVSSGDILRSANNRTSVQITPEFQARTEPAKNFYIPDPAVTDWYADIPYLDESVDKPKLTMKFYAEGIEGSIEKFFDKITVSKTFTTKYGTKIHCALVGVLAVCGWK